MNEKNMEKKKVLKEETLDKVSGGAYPMKWRQCRDCDYKWYGNVKVKKCPHCGSLNTYLC